MPVAVEAEREDGGGRWTSFTPHEHDLRTQKHSRDHGSYPDSRTPRPPGQSTDGGQAPSVKTLLADQQVASRRRAPKSAAVAHHVIRKEGPNWVLLVGGALVTAIGVLIVRKRRPPVCEEKIIEKAVPTLSKDDVPQSGLFPTTRRESTGSRTSEPSTDSPFPGDAYMITHNGARSHSDGSRVGSEWGDDECIPPSPPSPPGQYEYAYQHTQFSKGSNHSGRTVITPTSPPGSYRETSATEGNDMPLSPVSRAGYSSRRDMVHRLRQQLKSRDETIHEMLAQISDQERTISLHQAHCRDLEGRLDAATKTLFESEREIQRLRKAVADYLTCHAPGSGDWDLPPMPDVALPEVHNDYSETTIDVFLTEQHESGQDVKVLAAEVKRLTKELKRQERQKRELERIANEKLMEHEILNERLEQLEEELEEANRKVFEKDLLLEAFENYQDYQTDAVDDLKRKLEKNSDRLKGYQTPSLIGRQSLPGSIYSKQLSKGKKEEPGSGKTEASKFPAGTVVRTNCALFQKSSDESPTKGSGGKGWFKTDESSSPGDASEDSDVDIANPAVGEKLVMKLQEDVDTLSGALAEHSKMIAEKRMETTRLVDELQRHNAVINDLQMKMEEDGDEKPATREQDWEKLFGLLSVSNSGTSAAQVQELSDKLEQIATQQRVEEETAELAKHQVKIRELKNRVEKLSSKFRNLLEDTSIVETATYQQASHIIAVGSELSNQLCLQEEEAMRTSREIARLSANLRLSSPYVPRTEKEALRKKLLSSSSDSLSPGMESGSLEPMNLCNVLANLQARFSTGSEEKPKESGDTLFDRPIYVSSAELTGPQSDGGLGSQGQEQYVYRPGFSGPSNRKFRRGFPIGSGSVKEPLAGGKRRASRSNKKGSSSEEREVVRSDSNRWTQKPRFQLASADANRQLLTYPGSSAVQNLFDTEQDVSSPDVRRSEFGTWLNETTVERPFLDAERIQKDDFLSGRPNSPNSRRQSACSFYSVEDSSFMRLGSPTNAQDDNVTPETSLESTKGSFGRFIFDMEKGSQVYVINPDEGVQDGFEDETTPMIPVTQLMASLGPKRASPATSAQDDCSFGSSISGLSTEILNALRETPEGGRGEQSSGTYSECSNSLDSSLDGMLDTALDDMVRLVSPPSSPAGTPESSFMSSHSETKSDSFYEV